MLRKGEPFEAQVPLRAVVGVTASKGELHMSLDSLPETMFHLKGDSFGPLDDEQMARLKAAVMDEFSSSSRDDVFHLDLKEWSGAYVVNSEAPPRRWTAQEDLS